MQRKLGVVVNIEVNCGVSTKIVFSYLWHHMLGWGNWKTELKISSLICEGRLGSDIPSNPNPCWCLPWQALLLNPAKASPATNLIKSSKCSLCQLSLITCTRVSQHWKFSLCARRKDTWPGVMADQEAGCWCHNQVKCTFDSKLGQIHKEEALDLRRSSYHSLEVRSTHTKVNWWVFM
jgi:hypothetical protein